MAPPVWQHCHHSNPFPTDHSLSSEEEEAIASGVFHESDLAKDHRLHYAEFEHVISRAPDFVNLFHITV